MEMHCERLQQGQHETRNCMGHLIDGRGMWEFIIWIIALDARCVFTLAQGKGDINQSVRPKKKKRNVVYPKTKLALVLQNLWWTGKYFPNIEEWEAYSGCVLSCCFNYFAGGQEGSGKHDAQPLFCINARKILIILWVGPGVALALV